MFADTWSHTFKDIDMIISANLAGGLDSLSFQFRQDKEGDGCNGIVVSHGPAHVEQRKGPYIKDVRKIFGILDPLPPPCPHFG